MIIKFCHPLLLASIALLFAAMETHGWGQPPYIRDPRFTANCYGTGNIRSTWFFLPGAQCLWGTANADLSCQGSAHTHTYSQAERLCSSRGFSVLDLDLFRYHGYNECVDVMLESALLSLPHIQSTMTFWTKDDATPDKRTILQKNKPPHAPTSLREVDINPVEEHFVVCSGIWLETRSKNSIYSYLQSPYLLKAEEANLACGLLGYERITGEFAMAQPAPYVFVLQFPKGLYSVAGSAYTSITYTPDGSVVSSPVGDTPRRFICQKNCGVNGLLEEDRCVCNSGWGGSTCDLRTDEDSVAVCEEKFIEGKSIWMFGPGATGASDVEMNRDDSLTFCRSRGLELFDWNYFDDEVYGVTSCVKAMLQKVVKARQAPSITVWTEFQLLDKSSMYQFNADGSDQLIFTADNSKLAYPACSVQYKVQTTSKGVIASLYKWHTVDYERAKQSCNYLGLDLLFDWELARNFHALNASFTKIQFPVRNWDQYVMNTRQSVVLGDHGRLSFRWGNLKGTYRILCGKLCDMGSADKDGNCICKQNYIGPRCSTSMYMRLTV
ncbi:uncharacterized protein LOC135828277 [Sycon ciliatum]|uniref:uncharacterized protein LOC135828277 n=1 Tax=Sycon ciliatum TaxID=27933 RepID=UPI0020A90A44|eukprot:scpid58720/ scgid7824/ 